MPEKGDIDVGLQCIENVSTQPPSHSFISPGIILHNAVLPVLEVAQRSVDMNCGVGNLLHLLVVDAKEQVRVFEEANFRRRQSIKWAVNLQSQPCRAR